MDQGYRFFQCWLGNLIPKEINSDKFTLNLTLVKIPLCTVQSFHWLNMLPGVQLEVKFSATSYDANALIYLLEDDPEAVYFRSVISSFWMCITITNRIREKFQKSSGFPHLHTFTFASDLPLWFLCWMFEQSKCLRTVVMDQLSGGKNEAMNYQVSHVLRAIITSNPPPNSLFTLCLQFKFHSINLSWYQSLHIFCFNF